MTGHIGQQSRYEEVGQVFPGAPHPRDFSGKHGSRKRGSKNTSKARGNPRQDDQTDDFQRNVRRAQKKRGDSTAHLKGRSFAAGRAAQEMCEQGACEDEGSYPARNACRALGGRLCFAKNQSSPRVGAVSPGLINPCGEPAAEWQKSEKPWVLKTQPGDLIETPQKKGGGASGENCDEYQKKRTRGPCLPEPREFPARRQLETHGREAGWDGGHITWVGELAIVGGLTFHSRANP